MQKYGALISVLFVLSACQPMVMGGASLGIQHIKLFENPDINLKAKNYAAADYLVGQAHTFLDQGDVIEVTPLLNIDDPETPADIATMIPEDIGERLIQLGYRADMDAVATVPIDPIKSMPKRDYVLSGYYKSVSKKLTVNLKLTAVELGRVVATFDYVMPTNREIRKLSKPKPRIIKIERSNGI